MEKEKLGRSSERRKAWKGKELPGSCRRVKGINSRMDWSLSPSLPLSLHTAIFFSSPLHHHKNKTHSTLPPEAIMKFSILSAITASALVSMTFAAPAINAEQDSHLIARAGDGDTALIKACIVNCVLNVLGCALSIQQGGSCACASGCNTSHGGSGHGGHGKGDGYKL
ncbi:hypothetical protein MVLG_04326 [Microbotryum lychnidis-dioicae p1A1 Lamole]|uniref:Uncharacterized protein n=1 Tax=Microbotryum lychnidis-dioicae (strain p1A1 Lamole / MvSl-1064) TaxID=683840 RepID=U5HAW0_USTV1|nr:hypothetical protein MVLG_04326 [Microbotryum lychnidis-dioicae p1A1 Lamole]|eukprot:KDE05294.1 hypothetical protein MVLG_04326 [Microbotryum lychnidis-dioicae p1A1 Lamole]